MNKIRIENLHVLFQKIISSDETGIEELYKNYKSLIMNIAFSIVKNRDLSEEIAQIVFMKIIKLEKSKLPTSYESSWLYAVTKNQAIEYLRKEHNEIDIDDIYDMPNLRNEIDEIIDIDNFNRIIKCLDEDEKEIVSLKIISNFTFKEIAEILKIPIGTVQWSYYKAVHNLKIFISNLAMFTITFLLYIANTQTKENVENKIEEDFNENTNKAPTFLGNITIQPDTSVNLNGAHSTMNIKEAGTLGICSIFLLLTIIWGIIFAKYQQKRKKKSSK